MRRCVRARLRWRTLCLWLLLLGFTVVSVTLSNLFNRHQNWVEHQTAAPLRLLEWIPSPPELEVMVDSRDPASERGLDVGPLDSMHEDQLLLVPSALGTKHTAQKKRGYKLLMPGVSKEPLARRELRLEQSAERKEVSERIPRRRGVLETRHQECLREQYSEAMPSASVIICFRNEAWSTLLHTIHSVLDTAPPQHLKEVLLLDLDSQQGELKSELREYMSRLKGVRLIRSSRRLGVGRCRTLGASRATGEVLVLMDPHCECHSGWLEPLLERVAQDRTRVVSPMMDVIDGQTFQYNATQWAARGVFDWRLDFHWEHSPQLQREDAEAEALPLQSPVLGGAVLAVDRQFFLSIGAYDPGMVLWEVQQTELSIRVWSCGGSMEVLPCSRVAHLNHRSPLYNLPDKELLQKDKIRLADTWLDGYRRMFYSRDTLAHFIRQSESPNITERSRLKKTLGCRNFHWFLTTVYPQLYIPQDRAGLSGELYSVGSGSCVEPPRGQALQGGPVVIAACSGTGNQHCELNSEGELRWGPRGDLCLDADKDKVLFSPCSSQRRASSSQQWSFRKVSGQLVHSQSQLCLEAVTDSGQSQNAMGVMLLRPCAHHPQQQWHFEQLVSPEGI